MIQKTETRVVKKYGNSGGVYLPSSWIGGTVEIAMVSSPPNPRKDIPLAFAEKMEHIVSILLYGSYATGEHTQGSDIDVIVVTDNHAKDMKPPKGLKQMNYDLRVISTDDIRRATEKDILLSKTLEDAKAILNDSFLDELRSIKPKGTVRERISLARSSLEIMKSLFQEKGDHASLVYPLIMRIKEMLLLECAMQSRKYSPKLLEERLLAKGLARSDYRKLMAYYRAVRDGKGPGKPGFKEPSLRLLLQVLEEMIDSVQKK